MGEAYYSKDFDISEWISAAKEMELPENFYQFETHENFLSAQDWDSFYETHQSGMFFKERNYIRLEFKYWLELVDQSQGRVLEVGCGHGCTIFPLLQTYSKIEFIATDYSRQALNILRKNLSFNVHRIPSTCLWNILHPAPLELPTVVNSILCIFTMSAIHPNFHLMAIKNMISLLPLDGTILFRDYGIYDMTMFRHTKRYDQYLFGRNDGTLSYYFDLDYTRNLFNNANMEVVELEYATVIVRNRRSNIDMKRVFIHGVFRKR